MFVSTSSDPLFYHNIMYMQIYKYNYFRSKKHDNNLASKAHHEW